ncbi:obscurin [Gambusia affinis]|uniref:obscurin n=1 Tax=Gambusia affinis TaxID=33528 RepID=UPI001CDCFE4D|nr:obscurin [Gambusia affinis]XP_043952824.1 obscurin [Gambusia affinis]
MFSPRGLQSMMLLVLLGLGRHDVEASEGKQVIHKRVGDSVELSSNLPTEGVKRATWKYKNSIVADKDSGLFPTNPFQKRVKFNNTTLSLTIRDLTLQDSGEFSFTSTTDRQRPSVSITLLVHEPISTNSIVFSNVTEDGSNGVCTVFLECKANPHSDVTYSWTVGTQTRNGSRLQYSIKPQDGDTTFTCTASNVISEKLASTTLRCSNTGTNSTDDVEASEGKQVIHKRVGDSVELSSNLPTEGVKRATWNYKNSIVADKDKGLAQTNPFQDRVKFNNTTLSLTIRDLTLQDSGEFSFTSRTDRQRPSVSITLLVHEPISTNLIVFSNVTEDGSNEVCTVFLECKANPHNNVTYRWSVGTQTRNGSRLQYNITPQDGDTTFTCTASNVISEKLAFKTLKCSNTTGLSSTKGIPMIVWISVAAGGGLLIIIIIIVVSVCLCKRKWSGSDSNELTVYADISDFSSEVGSSDKPCSLYDTIDSRNSPDRQMPQTVYDKIQIQRMRKTSVSPYQEVS